MSSVERVQIALVIKGQYTRILLMIGYFPCLLVSWVRSLIFELIK